MANPRVARRLAWIGIPIIFVALVVAFWNWDWFIPIVDARASAAIGRKVTIAHLHVRLGRIVRMTAEDVTIANPPDWPSGDPAFASVRTCYNEEIKRLCASKESLFTYSTVIARFEAYSEACNANSIAPKEYNGKRLVFWELGKTISGLASDADPWVPSALEVSLHANIFLRECKQLSDFLGQYEVTQ